MSQVVVPGRFHLGLLAAALLALPGAAAAMTSWAEAKRWFNFGTLEVG